MKKIVIIIAVTTIPLITLVGVLYFVGIMEQQNVVKVIEEEVNDIKACKADEDCVPATCCHSTDVVNKDFAPDCSNFKCTMSCETVLDCGSGKPVCDEGVCDINVLRESGKVVY